MRKYFVLLLLLLLMACSATEGEKGLATIEPLEEFDTKQAAERLALGPIFEFDITYHDPENTKMELWIEVFEYGTEVSGEQGQIRTIDENIDVDSESIGWTIIDPAGETLDLRLYNYSEDSRGTYTSKMDTLLEQGFPTSHGYLIEGSKELEVGEEYTLATFYQSDSESTIEDFDSLDELRNNNRVAFLMKIKVDEK